MRLYDYKNHTKVHTYDAVQGIASTHYVPEHLQFEQVLKLYPSTTSFAHLYNGRLTTSHIVLTNQVMAFNYETF